jgi:rod shape-determining protein MreC
MRNLIAFFRRFRVFLVFALLQVIALSTYFSFLQYPRAQYLTSASTISGAILKARFDLTKHFNLSKNNENLQRENVALRNRLPLSYIQLQNGLVKINDTLFNQQYEYSPATVINSTLTKRNNYFTLNVGYAQGIKRGMGVFSEKGIVGRVHNSSKHFAVVKSVLTENINIDVMVEKLGLFGLMKWDGRDPRFGNITGISNDLKLKKWLKVVTRGGSGIFPRGLTVGYIAKLKPVEGKPLWDVIIRYSEDYRTLQRVYVIKNLLSEEQQKLELAVPSDNDQQEE